jgi:GNAT superfamily N-acetyltransferase
MKTAELADPGYRRDIGGGLQVRWSRAEDAPNIAEVCEHVFRRTADDPPHLKTGAWVLDLLSGRHPHMGPGDYAIVEDTTNGRIVSGTCLISYEIELEGIRLPFGRPEAVFTHPDYRNRGLVRAIFELVHARSAARGHLVQGITGIPFYYRLYGYEYAADLGGEASVYFSTIPSLKEGETEKFRFRTATDADLGVVKSLYDLDRSRYALSSPVDESYLRWIASGQHPQAAEGWKTRLVLDAGGGVVGYVFTGPRRESDELTVVALGTRQGTRLSDVLPSTLRALRGVAGEAIPRLADLPPPARLRLHLGPDHPVYGLLKEEQVARRTRPYAWYLRVPDLKALLESIKPLLERRLAASVVAGYTGELRLTFYPKGLRLLFEAGRLAAIEEWREDHAWGPRAQASIPSLVFLKLLFGHRSLVELRDAFPDVIADDDARPLLEALFPRRPSWLLPLD